MRMAIFIDMSYLRQCDDWHVDMRKLPLVIKSSIEEKIGTTTNLVKVVAVGSMPENVSATDNLEGFYNFHSTLKSIDLYEVIINPIDYHGFRLHREDRLLSDYGPEREFIPFEKGVDTALVTRMLELYYRDRAIDVCCVVSGDQDMIPAILSLRSSGCIIYAAGINNLNTMGSQFARNNIPRIDLQDYREEIERNQVSKTEYTQEQVQQAKKQIEALFHSIRSEEEIIPSWSKDRLRLQMNIWACQWHELNDIINDYQEENLKEVFKTLFRLSSQYRPGTVPALKKSFSGNWKEMINGFEIQLKNLEQSTVLS